jgi:hypothetical protein
VGGDGKQRIWIDTVTHPGHRGPCPVRVFSGIHEAFEFAYSRLLGQPLQLPSHRGTANGNSRSEQAPLPVQSLSFDQQGLGFAIQEYKLARVHDHAKRPMGSGQLLF